MKHLRSAVPFEGFFFVLFLPKGTEMWLGKVRVFGWFGFRWKFWSCFLAATCWSQYSPHYSGQSCVSVRTWERLWELVWLDPNLKRSASVWISNFTWSGDANSNETELKPALWLWSFLMHVPFGHRLIDCSVSRQSCFIPVVILILWCLIERNVQH